MTGAEILHAAWAYAGGRLLADARREPELVAAQLGLDAAETVALRVAAGAWSVGRPPAGNEPWARAIATHHDDPMARVWRLLGSDAVPDHESIVRHAVGIAGELSQRRVDYSAASLLDSVIHLARHGADAACRLRDAQTYLAAVEEARRGRGST